MTDAPPRSPLPPAGAVVLGAVALGGACGATLRSLVDGSAGSSGLHPGTLAVNVGGSLLLGLLAGWLGVRSARPWVRPLLGTGLLGGFTTYSTFATQVVLGVGERPGVTAAYVVLTLLLAVGGAAAGLVLGRRLGGPAGGTPRGAVAP